MNMTNSNHQNNELPDGDSYRMAQMLATDAWNRANNGEDVKAIIERIIERCPDEPVRSLLQPLITFVGTDSERFENAALALVQRMGRTITRIEIELDKQKPSFTDKSFRNLTFNAPCDIKIWNETSPGVFFGDARAVIPGSLMSFDFGWIIETGEGAQKLGLPVLYRFTNIGDKNGFRLVTDDGVPMNDEQELDVLNELDGRYGWLAEIYNFWTAQQTPATQNGDKA